MNYYNVLEKISRHSHTCACDNCEGELSHSHSHEEHVAGAAHNFDVVTVLRLSVSAVLFIWGILLKSETLETVLMAAAALIAGYDILIGAVINLFKRRTFDENLLMTVAAIAAFSVGEGHEGAAVMFLFQAGELLQDYAINKTRREITRLARLENSDGEISEHEPESKAYEKGDTEKSITSFAKIYTPVVLSLAVILTLTLTFAFKLPFAESLNRSLVFLVIACPCALVISVPLTYFAGIGGASKLGILFKSSKAMRVAASAKAVVFDESAALVSNNLRVNSVKSDRMDAGMMLKVAAHIEAYSSHSIAKAIKASYGGPVYPELIDDYEEYSGEGVCVTISGIRLSLGRREFVEGQGTDIGDDASPEYAVYMSAGGKYAGRITLTYAIRDASLAALRSLFNTGSEQIAVLTGENRESRGASPCLLDIDEYYTGVMPEEKIIKLKEIKDKAGKKGTLVFVGGSASAQVMDAADATIAIGGGTGGVIGNADIVIADDNPGKVALAIQAAKQTKGIVYQNICFALGIKAAVLILGAFGMSPLWFAVFADVGVTLLAILNSMRAYYIRQPDGQALNESAPKTAGTGKADEERPGA